MTDLDAFKIGAAYLSAPDDVRAEVAGWLRGQGPYAAGVAQILAEGLPPVIPAITIIHLRTRSRA